MQTSEKKELLIWRSGEHFFGLELSECREIIQDASLTEIPQSDAYVAGIANIRGAVLGIYDLPVLLGYRKQADRAAKTIVRIKKAGRDFGIVADGILDVISLRAADLRKTPGNFSAAETAFVRSIAVLPERIALMVQTNAFDFA